MTDAPDMKTSLHNALRDERRANLSKLDGLSDYDLRRPMTPTGTNLLGVLKHLGGVEHNYLGETFGRTLAEPIPHDDPWTNDDMWARPDESRDYIIDWYQRACDHANETVDTLDLDAPGHVAHWPEDQRGTTLGATLIVVLRDECRHGGHIDIIRELIDGRADPAHAEFGDADKWRRYVFDVQAGADVFADNT